MQGRHDETERWIQGLLTETIDSMYSPFLDKALKDFEAELRSKILETVTQVSNYYQVETNQNNLVITVRIPNGKV